jgi:hypothetical protein
MMGAALSTDHPSSVRRFRRSEEDRPMLHRKIYQLCSEGREVWIFLRDQQRWIERARIIDIEGDLVTLRYETDEEDELCSWEELVRLESIGSVTQKLATVPRSGDDLPVAEECPEAEQIRPVTPPGSVNSTEEHGSGTDTAS